MCTVSWVHHGSGYELFCNRDELKTRLDARPPRLYTAGDVRFFAPVDGNSGGTWIAVNDAGLTACLLNGHGTGPLPRGTTRGAIVRRVIRKTSAREALRAAGDLDLRQFAPFLLAVVEAGGASCLLDWNGRERAIVEDAERRLPLTSSSHQPAAVAAGRHRIFERIVAEGKSIDPQALHRFHTSHEPGPSAYSVCMHRQDAETVSYTRIRVRPDRIEMRYHPSPPCRPSNPTLVQLCRK